MQNSKLIKTYIEFDWRCHALSILVKKWAKDRLLVGNISHKLSSYAFILMVIYFLQKIVEPPILPNLQNPSLIQTSSTSQFSKTMDGLFNISFCQYSDNVSKEKLLNGERNTMSLGNLLVQFFYYFGFMFDPCTDFVTIRKERLNADDVKNIYLEPTMKTTVVEGGCKKVSAYESIKSDHYHDSDSINIPTMLIEDPFENSDSIKPKNLGKFLNEKTMNELIAEFQRSYKILCPIKNSQCKIDNLKSWSILFQKKESYFEQRLKSDITDQDVKGHKRKRDAS